MDTDLSQMKDRSWWANIQVTKGVQDKKKIEDWKGHKVSKKRKVPTSRHILKFKSITDNEKNLKSFLIIFFSCIKNKNQIDLRLFKNKTRCKKNFLSIGPIVLHLFKLFKRESLNKNIKFYHSEVHIVNIFGENSKKEAQEIVQELSSKSR